MERNKRKEPQNLQDTREDSDDSDNERDEQETENNHHFKIRAPTKYPNSVILSADDRVAVITNKLVTIWDVENCNEKEMLKSKAEGDKDSEKTKEFISASWSPIFHNHKTWKSKSLLAVISNTSLVVFAPSPSVTSPMSVEEVL
jgi:hypothetical protein